MRRLRAPERECLGEVVAQHAPSLLRLVQDVGILRLLG